MGAVALGNRRYGLLRRGSPGQHAVPVHTAVLHLGRVKFPITGPLRYSMSGRDAVKTIDLIRPQTAVPVHFEGWSHFSEQETALREALTAASASVTSRLRWLERGEATELQDPD